MKRLLKLGIAFVGVVTVLYWNPISGTVYAMKQSAAPIVVSPQYTHTRKVVATLSIDDSGNATCAGKIGAYNKNSTISITVKLLKKNGKTWQTVKTWNDSGSGNIDFSCSKSYQVTHGVYKVKVLGIITTPDGQVEHVSKTTSEKTF